MTAIGIAGYVVLALGLGLFILVSVKKLASHSTVVRVWKLLEIRGPATIGIAGLGFAIAGEEANSHPAEDVIDNALGDANLGVRRVPHRLEPHVG